MSDLLVEPHLIELVRTMNIEGFSIPRARPTNDIDAFLYMDVFLAPPDVGVTRFRNTLESLGYTVLDRARFFQFTKPSGSGPIKLDLHARLPHVTESSVKCKAPRVGRKQQPQQPLHAYATPEAFAIEERPRQVPLAGPDPQGRPFAGLVQVAHPFAALCMKLKAAMDHERSPPATRKPVGQRHAYDALLLLAMLDRQEYDETAAMVRAFADHPELLAIQAGIPEIFGARDLPGCRTIELQAHTLGEPSVDMTRFSALLGQLFTGH